MIYSPQIPMIPWDMGWVGGSILGPGWLGLVVAGRAGWAQVFTRLPVAAWAPTSTH